jgi:hypothetical protein
MPEDYRGRRCIALLSGIPNRVTLSRYRRIVAALGGRYDCVLLLADELHEAAAALSLHDAVCFGADDIFLPAFGTKSASRKIVPGNNDLALLALHRSRPQYEHIWIVEHDIFFPDGPEILAAIDAATDADLIVPWGLQAYSKSAGWYWWRSFFQPQTTADDVNRDCWMRSLLCIMRLSSRLLHALDGHYRSGWHGHFEAMVPTTAKVHGLPFESVAALGSRVLGRTVITGNAFDFQKCTADPQALIFHPVKSLQAETPLLEGRG